MRNVGVTQIAACSMVLCLAACSSGPYCDRDGAEGALAGAMPGEVVELGACEVEGPLHVPPGVTLAGTSGSVLVAPVDSGGVVLLGGEPASEVRDLSVRVEGRIGILARGGGSARITNVEVDAQRGIGIGAAELASLEMSSVTVQGPIDAGNASDTRWLRVAAAPPEMGPCPDPSDCDCEPGEVFEADGQVCDAEGRRATWTATFGLVLSEVSSAALTDVEVAGLAQWGAVLTDSDVTWSGGGVRDTLGVGIRQVGGALTLEDASATGTLGGVRGERTYAIVTSDAGRLEARRVEVSDNERYGVLVSGGTGLLDDVLAEGNGDAAVWVAESDDFELCGTGTRLSNNGFAGVVVASSSGVRLADGLIEATTEQERLIGSVGLLRVGDGVHISDTSGAIALSDLSFSGNDRSGIVVDLGASGAGDVTFSGVTVSGTGTQLGAIGGRVAMPGQLSAEMPMGWDAGITRMGAPETNDMAFTGTFPAVTETLPGTIGAAGDVLAVVAPMF